MSNFQVGDRVCRLYRKINALGTVIGVRPRNSLRTDCRLTVQYDLQDTPQTHSSLQVYHISPMEELALLCKEINHDCRTYHRLL